MNLETELLNDNIRRHMLYKFVSRKSQFTGVFILIGKLEDISRHSCLTVTLVL